MAMKKKLKDPPVNEIPDSKNATRRDAELSLLVEDLFTFIEETDSLASKDSRPKASS